MAGWGGEKKGVQYMYIYIYMYVNNTNFLKKGKLQQGGLPVDTDMTDELRCRWRRRKGAKKGGRRRRKGAKNGW